MGRPISEDEAKIVRKLHIALKGADARLHRHRGAFYAELVRLEQAGVTQASIARVLNIAPPTLHQKLREIAPRYASKASIEGA